MAIVYNRIYQGEFCDDRLGGNNIIRLSKRMDSSDPIPFVTLIQFAGLEQNPVQQSYKDDGDYKITLINGSGCQINIKAIGSFELSSLYTADEREWLVEITGTKAWSGWIIPDSCSEPYASKPYDVSIRCTDAVGTLNDVDFLQDNGSKYTGFISDKELLYILMLKTGLALPMIIGVNTFEATMDTGVCPLEQTYINCARFYDEDNNPYKCDEVLRSILARWSARLHQFNGKWQIINILEKSLGEVDTWEYDPDGAFDGIGSIGNAVTAGGDNRTLQPTEAIVSYAKAMASSVAYYQYGYPSNKLANGDFNDAVPPGLPDDWTATAGTSYYTYFRVDERTGDDTLDVVLVITDTPTDTDNIISNDYVQIKATEYVQVAFDMLAQGVPDTLISSVFLLDILIVDDASNYYTTSGWTTTPSTYQIRYKAGDLQNQLGINFEIPGRDFDYGVKIALRNVHRDGTSDQYDTAFNNVKLQPQVSQSQTKPPLGVYTRLTMKSTQTYKREPILLLHGDETNDQRTSQISIGSATVITPPTTWTRQPFPLENQRLIWIVANTELLSHSKPYRVFEADFKGVGYIDINTLLTIDLLDGTYIFLSGDFNLKSGIHRLRFAQVLTDAIDFTSELNIEDYGADKSIQVRSN